MMTATIATACDRLYATLTDQQPTMADEYGVLVLETVCAALESWETAAYPELLTAFVEAERDGLAEMIRTYGPASGFRSRGAWGSHPYELVHSPAVLAVCERLSVRPMWLSAVWGEQWESDTMLDDVRGAWGR